jgi:magnesium chelatase family protein
MCEIVQSPMIRRWTLDFHIDVPAVRSKDLTGNPPADAESSADIRKRVISARDAQRQRFADEKIFSNSAMTPRMVRRYCKIDPESEQMLERAMTRLGLSARAYDRILKVSRTIADLEGAEDIRSPHVAEAVGYRSLDRTYWT